MKEKPRYNSLFHHRRSIRLKGYDYSQLGLYFITVCCREKECLFGKIEGDEMILNNVGVVADQAWLEIPKHFPNAILHEHIVMPNHIHGIIELSPSADNINYSHVGAENLQPPPNTDEKWVVILTLDTRGPEDFQPLPDTDDKQNEFQKMIPCSIGSIVKGFKIGVTKWCKDNLEMHAIWQRSYYEHIIRNEESYNTISEYIINNPAKWDQDKFYK